MIKKIPKNLQGILWSRSVDHLDLQQDQYYIVHQILQYGNLAQIDWLIKTYSLPKVKRIFTTQPAKVYDPASFNFVKNFILNSNTNLNVKKYFKTTLRNSR